MTNKITIAVEFYFKGEAYKFSEVLNLDKIMQQYKSIPSFHHRLAQSNNLDSYSYEYEMMLAEDIEFSNAEGWVIDYVHQNGFDQTGFEQRWHEQNILDGMAAMLKQQLDIDDIEQHPALKSVLLATYKLAKSSEQMDHNRF